MKLKTFKQKCGYEFIFIFENGEQKHSDIKGLVAQYLKPDELQTATINHEWGCLEFKNGTVDIEPHTLYKYCVAHNLPMSTLS
jgi:hypothetical protein